MQESKWHDASKEIPGDDEALCVLLIETSFVSDDGDYIIKNYVIGYIFADQWYNASDHEKIECHWRTVTHWMELPELSE